MAIEITPADVVDAEDFIATVVSDGVPDGRFTDGTAMRDIAIKALAMVSAYFRKENNEARALRSLLTVKDIARTNNDPAVADATDALLSNVFYSRKPGRYARGKVTIYVGRKQDYVIPRTTQFLYDRTLAFYPDSTADLVIPSSQVQPLLDGTGRVFGYTFNISLIAAATGPEYNVQPGTWAGTGGFSPFISRVFSGARFEGGEARESTLGAIDSANTAMAARVLINGRSTLVTLSQEFPAASSVLTVGMGEAEMQRDYIESLQLHIGGHFDVYADLPIASATFEGICGGSFARPDGVVNVFTDTGVPDWTLTGVQVGDVIRVVDGMVDVPRDYVIRTVSATELTVSERYAFTETASPVSYHIYRPLFGPDVQIYPAFGTATTGATSDVVHTSGRIVLPGMPHYDILDVAVVNPDPGDPRINDADGFVHFYARVNDTPTLTGADPAVLPFRVIGRHPLNAQSSLAFDEIEISPIYDGKRVRVTYETLAGFSQIDAYMRDRYQRVNCGNNQLKGRNPVYLTMTIPWRYAPGARVAVDVAELRKALVAYINSFPSYDELDVSDLSTFVKNFSPSVGTVFAFNIQYTLFAPDGRMYDFETADIVALDPARANVATPITFTQLYDMSVSDRTVRYLTRFDRVQVEIR